MSRQLTENPDNGCVPLGKQGACGALFRLTLESYRYTFVAKGTVPAFTAKLKHECLICRHLDKVEGELIVHMLLMSWAGEQARKDLMLAIGRDLAAETSGAVIKMLNRGVEHRDIRPPNAMESRGQTCGAGRLRAFGNLEAVASSSRDVA
jgi:hypothetical protein